jgi:amidophosphoribosyltransferase
LLYKLKENKHNKSKKINAADKGINESCGVFGIYAPGENIAEIIFYGLQALQHRGQESAGMAVSDRENILVFKDLGLGYLRYLINKAWFPCRVI